MEAADAVGDGKLRAFYERQLQYALATHERFLPGDENPHRVMDRLHAYSYFLEALLVADRGADCAAAIRFGIDSVARYLREIAPSFERSDVYAQLLRIRCLAAWAGVTPMDYEAAAFEAGRLALFQLDDTDARVCGGFTFGRKGKVAIPHMNPVSTGFALQALVFWDQLQRGEPAPPSLLLI